MDSEQIKIDALVRQEKFYRDTEQWENLRSVWHPDNKKTHVEISWITGRVDEFIQGSKAMAQGHTQSFHSVQPCDVKISDDGQRALANSLITIYMRTKVSDVDVDLVSWARMLNRLERVSVMPSEGSSQWKITRFQAIYLKDSVSFPFASPSRTSNILLEVESYEARPSYKGVGWIMSKSGVKCRGDLPGFDDEKTWRYVFDRDMAWLDTGEN